MPWVRRLYPANWPELRHSVMERAGWRREGSPRYPDCRAAHGELHPVTGSKVVLMTAHLFDDNHGTQDITRLRAWCQRCHVTYDAGRHARKAPATHRRRRGDAGHVWTDASISTGNTADADGWCDRRRGTASHACGWDR